MPSSQHASQSPPAAAVTLLFTDIEGSTRLWEQEGARMSQALAAHDRIARHAVERCRGTVMKMTGDGMCAVFDNALDALVATLDMQCALADSSATFGVPLRVRCGVHAGLVERRDNDYFGTTVNRAARIMSAAHGAQVLLSEVVVDNVRDVLPAAVSLRDLGRVRLKDLSTPEHVFQVVHPKLRREFPSLRSLEATPNNLPQQATSFIGREKELTELRRLLIGNRILTLLGSGGCGKTRLGLQLAADAIEHFADGAWLVELAALSEPALVSQTVAVMLGIKEGPVKRIAETLAEHLEDKRLLLLLDNCEHLLDGCARVADFLVRRCPHLTILVTSRQALRIDGEQVYRVPSMAVPDPREAHTPASAAAFEAVQLFTDRALLARPDFRVTVQNVSVLASVCKRLDGIPLAIELAAARVRFLSLEEIDARLDERFRLLTDGSRTALPRQQTLRSLIDWSYDLLSDSEKLTLQRLAVFAGGWTLAAAESICAGERVEYGEILDLLTSLADKSLLVVDQSDDRGRYRLLETVRQYAREKLADRSDSEAVRERHRVYFLALAEEAEPELGGTRQGAWLRRLEEEHENLRAGLEWSMADKRPEGGLRLCSALERFWIARGHLAEGRDWCARVLGKSTCSENPSEFARTLNTAGALAYCQADYPAARLQLEESVAIARMLGDRAGLASSLHNLGSLAWTQGDYPIARALHEESLAIFKDLGNRAGAAAALANLGAVACEEGDYLAARALQQQSLAIRRDLGDRSGTAVSLNRLGNVDLDQGNVASARAFYEESLAIHRELADPSWIAFLLGNLGTVMREQGDYAAALAKFAECQTIWRKLGHRAGVAWILAELGELAFVQQDYAVAERFYRDAIAIRHELGHKREVGHALEGLAGVAAAIGSLQQAARLWGAAKRIRQEVGSPMPPFGRPRQERRVAAARKAWGDDAAFDQACQEGSALPLEEVIALALNKPRSSEDETRWSS